MKIHRYALLVLFLISITAAGLCNELDEKVQSIVAECYRAGITGDAQRAQWLHDWMRENAEYDWYDENSEYENEISSAESILLKGIGNSKGFANAYKMLLDACDIDNYIVTGIYDYDDYDYIEVFDYDRFYEYSWNLAKLDGTWYHIDVAADDLEYGSSVYRHFGYDDEHISEEYVAIFPKGLPAAANTLTFSWIKEEDLGEPYKTEPISVPLDLQMMDNEGNHYSWSSFPNEKIIFIFEHDEDGFLPEFYKYDALLTSNDIRVIVLFNKRGRNYSKDYPRYQFYYYNDVSTVWNMWFGNKENANYFVLPMIFLRNASGEIVYKTDKRTNLQRLISTIINM